MTSAEGHPGDLAALAYRLAGMVESSVVSESEAIIDLLQTAIAVDDPMHALDEATFETTIALDHEMNYRMVLPPFASRPVRQQRRALELLEKTSKVAAPRP